MSASKAYVVVTDYTFPDLKTEERILTESGCQLVGRQCKSEGELIDLCREADAVITQFARISANVINSMPRARAIVRYGIGVDNVDLEAASRRGIPVCNVPDYCVDEVADHTLAFLLSMTRQVVAHATYVRGGKWGLATPLAQMKTLRDMTVGVVGCGRIGRQVMKRLVPFKCAVMVFDPMVAPEEIRKLGAQPSSFNALLERADVVTLHCPSTPQTRKIMNREAFAKLKPGAILLNIGRGDLVDIPALLGALESRRLGGAALDVFDPEPIPSDHPILKMSNVILSPHIASASVTAVKILRETAADLALKAVRGERLPNVVNEIKSAEK